MVWDSGRVASSATAGVPYGGPPLAGGTRYRWKVQAWDETGAASGWSAAAAFETGLSDRTGGWHASDQPGAAPRGFPPPSEPGPSDPVLNALMPAPYLRREFRVDGPVASARLYITALGLYEARLNGQRVGDVLAPAPGPCPWPATLAPLVPAKRSSRSDQARTSSPDPRSPGYCQ